MGEHQVKIDGIRKLVPANSLCFMQDASPLSCHSERGNCRKLAWRDDLFGLRLAAIYRHFDEILRPGNFSPVPLDAL